MARVYLTTVGPIDDPACPFPFDDLERMRKAARGDKFGIHEVTDDESAADIILFVDRPNTIRHYFAVRKNVLYRAYPEKCFLFNRTDMPVPFLPGVYCSIPRRWYSAQRTRTGSYLNASDEYFVSSAAENVQFNYLYSFIGQRSTHAVRDRVFALEHPDQFLFDTSEFWPYGALDETKRQELERQYVEVSQASRFILCPRGTGCSSIRLFECLRMGRAPVIISDDWVPPEGPDWDSFSIRVRHDDVYKIPALLEARRSDAHLMGEHAREAWEEWFAVDAVFHSVVEWCLAIRKDRRLPERVIRVAAWRQFFSPGYLRILMREIRWHVLAGRRARTRREATGD